MQSRRSAGLAAPVRTIPFGLDATQHYHATSSPLDTMPSLPDDLAWALDKLDESPVDQLGSRRPLTFDSLERNLAGMAGQPVARTEQIKQFNIVRLAL